VTQKTEKPGTRRTSPLIWLKQITLYKSLSPFEEIRTIPFTPGLNIIQGKSDDSDEVFESGHGNGKTTLCRLIRFCLGEKTFGQEHVVVEVKHCFPNGYVGAIILIDGEEWAVLRTVGSHRKEYAQQGISLADFTTAEDRPAYSTFLKRIQEVGLSRLQHREVLSGGDPIQWSHILALSSRDQESRYDRFWNVRPARSDSGLSKFTKIDVSLSVRAMLGILNIREPQILKRQTELDSELSQLRETIKAKVAEPASRITLLRSRLLNELDVEQADTVSLKQGDMFGITQKQDARIEKLQAEAKEVEQEISDLDTQINGATTRLNEIHQNQERKVVAKEATAVGSKVVEQSESPEGKRQTLLEKMERSCPTGEMVRECDKVIEKLAQLEAEIENKKRSHEQSEMLKTVQQRDQVEANLNDEAKKQESPLAQVRARLKKLNDEKNDALDRRRTIKELLRVIPIVVNELLKWHRIEQGEEPNQELTTLRSDETLKVDEGEKLKTELSELLVNQNKRIQQFQQRFHGIVQRAINASFKGIVSVAKDELAFRISRERSLAGEAYETLAVLLADVAILMESSSDSVCHPGFLIHDSPREADLNVRLYERMLETVFSLMKDEKGNTPYQYIVTTTTQPSELLRSPDVTKVTLSSGGGSLFGMQLEAGVSGERQKTLFDTTEVNE
jgi:hypothetical protein